jgi:hypothetical protein
VGCFLIGPNSPDNSNEYFLKTIKCFLRLHLQNNLLKKRWQPLWYLVRSLSCSHPSSSPLTFLIPPLSLSLSLSNSLSISLFSPQTHQASNTSRKQYHSCNDSAKHRDDRQLTAQLLSKLPEYPCFPFVSLFLFFLHLLLLPDELRHRGAASSDAVDDRRPHSGTQLRRRSSFPLGTVSRYQSTFFLIFFLYFHRLE